MITRDSAETVKLEATFRIDAQRLAVTYRLVNVSNTNIYVLDAIFELKNDKPQLDDRLVYTLVNDKNLTLLRGVLPIPPYVQVEVPEVPYARTLPAHDAIHGRILSPLPMPYNNPYDFTTQQGVKICTSVKLRVGYVLSQDLPVRPRKAMIADRILFKINYREAIGVQRVLETDAWSARVPLRKY